MLNLIKYRQRGDTLIEVLFAVSVFSLVAIGGLTIMNQGSNTTQRALEITLVRQQIDAQAEGLRFLHDAYIASYRPGATYSTDVPAGQQAIAQWAKMDTDIKATNSSAASPFGNFDSCPETPPSGSFIINTRTATFANTSVAKYKKASVYSRVNYSEQNGQVLIDSTEGLWIEAVRSAPSTDTANQSNIGFIDFHIRACWDSVGQVVPMTIGTIVRLYEPR